MTSTGTPKHPHLVNVCCMRVKLVKAARVMVLQFLSHPGIAASNAKLQTTAPNMHVYGRCQATYFLNSLQAAQQSETLNASSSRTPGFNFGAQAAAFREASFGSSLTKKHLAFTCTSGAAEEAPTQRLRLERILPGPVLILKIRSVTPMENEASRPTALEAL
eukprot:TRINITY_DN35956_c0_g2_i1.p2 TRINITY_DN35956_c0_g2~~TRINITY_DN35956_c0_g2_i1.p2  ORF type:complete len:162 (-),score=29.19 TRINITY_DN35956_c0_g2_i1:3110-3595(-)